MMSGAIVISEFFSHRGSARGISRLFRPVEGPLIAACFFVFGCGICEISGLRKQLGRAFRSSRLGMALRSAGVAFRFFEATRRDVELLQFCIQLPGGVPV